MKLKSLLFTLPFIATAMVAQANESALKTVKSAYPAVETVETIKHAVTEKGISSRFLLQLGDQCTKTLSCLFRLPHV
ncbi:Uncharacterised protein [Pasteurella multocida subsp. septica]|nr:Uncharacterised protein [Pasteurella multocida subsp. septica]